MELLTVREKLKYNLFNGLLLKRDAVFDMYVLSESNHENFGYHGIDTNGINTVFDLYAKWIYKIQRALFLPLYSRDSKGRFKSNNNGKRKL